VAALALTGPLTLDVADGELLTVVGTGTSELIRTLAGLEPLPVGDVLIDGVVATSWTPAARDVAVVFADHAPYPHLSVRENLALPLRVAGLPPDRLDAVADQLGLGVHLDRMPSQLTRAQRQRVAVGRALVRPSPAAYLLDQPLSAEPSLRPLLRGLVRGTTTVWTCASVAEAAIGDRVAVLTGGAVAQLGTPAELAREPATLDIALLTPLNVLPGTATAEGIRTPLGVLPLTAPPGEVLVGIRPADLVEGPGLTVLADPAGGYRHPALTRAAEADPRISPAVTADVDPAGRRTVTLTPTRVLLFDPATGAAISP
jgi:multiple sugar transport system ATP-binding protein